MANNRVSLPMSQGGLQRFFSDYKSKFQFGPDKVIFAAAVLAIIILLFHILNPLGY